jgi:hypothetical protein
LLLLSLVRYSYFFGIIRFCIVPSLSFTVLYTPAIAVYIIITHQYIYQLFSLLCAEILLLFVSILFFEIFYSFLDYARTVFAPVLTAYSPCFNFVLVRTRTIILVYLKINYLEAEAIYSKTTHNIPFSCTSFSIVGSLNTQININFQPEKNSVHTSNPCLESANYCLETPSSLEWNDNSVASTTKFKLKANLQLLSSATMHC